MTRQRPGMVLYRSDDFGDPQDPDWEMPRVLIIARDRSQRHRGVYARRRRPDSRKLRR